MNSYSFVMLVDMRLLAGGGSMLVAGLVLTGVLGMMQPAGQSGMTEEQILDLLEQERQNEDMRMLAGILAGVGFLLILVSFGARRRRRGGAKESIKKPA